MTISALNLGYTGTQYTGARRCQLICNDSLSAVQTAGFIPSEYNVQPTDIFDVWYGTNSTSYGVFVTSRAINGTITLSANSGDGVTPSNPALSTVASVTPGTYTTGNILVAGDSNGSIAPGAAAVATQFRTLNDEVLAADAAITAGLNLTAASLTSGPASASYSTMQAIANAGAQITATTNEVTATGNLGATSITAATTSIMSVGGNVMTSGAILTGHYIDADAPTNVTGSTTNFCATYVKGPQTGSLGSLIALNGKSASLLNITDGGSMIATPAGATPSGALRTFKVNIGGTDYQMLAAVTYS